MLRSKSPDMVRQEIYGYLLTHYAITTLICQAATEADIDPDRIKFTRTLRIARRTINPAAFPPDQHQHLRAAITRDITATRHLNPPRRHRTYLRVIKRGRHNSYRVKKKTDIGIRHDGPATITLANLAATRPAA